MASFIILLTLLETKLWCWHFERNVTFRNLVSLWSLAIVSLILDYMYWHMNLLLCTFHGVANYSAHVTWNLVVAPALWLEWGMRLWLEWGMRLLC